MDKFYVVCDYYCFGIEIETFDTLGEAEDFISKDRIGGNFTIIQGRIIKSYD